VWRRLHTWQQHAVWAAMLLLLWRLQRLDRQQQQQRLLLPRRLG
jgi:hypothetical protein